MLFIIIVCRLLNIKSYLWSKLLCCLCLFFVDIFSKETYDFGLLVFANNFSDVASFFFITSTIFIYNNAGSFITRDDVQAILIHLSWHCSSLAQATVSHRQCWYGIPTTDPYNQYAQPGWLKSRSLSTVAQHKDNWLHNLNNTLLLFLWLERYDERWRSLLLYGMVGACQP